jgi:hypothetical protein
MVSIAGFPLESSSGSGAETKSHPVDKPMSSISHIAGMLTASLRTVGSSGATASATPVETSSRTVVFAIAALPLNVKQHKKLCSKSRPSKVLGFRDFSFH